MIVVYNNREVELGDISGRHGDDICIEHACYVDTGEDLEDGELDEIQELFDEEIYTVWYEAQLRRAEDYYDCRD